MDARDKKGRPGSTRYAQSAGADRPGGALRYAGGWLGRLLNAFAG